MAKIGKGVLGTVQGAVSTIEGYNLRGVNVIRSKKKTYIQRNTVTMSEQRIAYSRLLGLFRLIPSGWLNLFYIKPKGHLSTWNNFVQLEINAFRLSFPDCLFEMKFGYFNSPTCYYSAIYVKEEFRIDFTRLTDTYASTSFDPFDIVNVLIITPTLSYVLYNCDNIRSSTVFSINVSGSYLDDQLFLFCVLSLSNVKGTRCLPCRLIV